MSARSRGGSARERLDARSLLFAITDRVGEAYGTEDFSLFLYSLVRMHRPSTVVELGTGYGVSAFWMAYALEQNGAGHLWTVDDFSSFEDDPTAIDSLQAHLRDWGLPADRCTSPKGFFETVARALGVEKRFTLIRGKIRLDTASVGRQPFARNHIDLLFSDFSHGPAEIVSLLGSFLPRMAPAASLFIDSASTSFTSYLLLEKLVAELNAGHVPAIFGEERRALLEEFVRRSRVVLVHLTERKPRSQNGTAWLKIEPHDALPHPLTRMRS